MKGAKRGEDGGVRYLFIGLGVGAVALVVGGVAASKLAFLIWIGVILFVLTLLAFLIRAIAGRKV